MKIRNVLWPSALAGTIALAACDPNAAKDTAGRAIQLSEWKPIEVHEVELNIPQLLSAKITKAEKRTRDNSTFQEQLTLDGGKGRILQERQWYAFYSEQNQKDLADKSKFEDGLKRFIGAALTTFDEPKKIAHESRSAWGYQTLVTISGSARRCFYANVGYRLKGSTVYGNDFGQPDTVLYVHYCDPNVGYEQFAKLLTKVDLAKK